MYLKLRPVLTSSRFKVQVLQTLLEQSFTTAYSSEESGIIEKVNQEVLRHLNAILFDSQVHGKWSSEQLPTVQRIMNTVEKTSTGVSPAVREDTTAPSSEKFFRTNGIVGHNGRSGIKTMYPDQRRKEKPLSLISMLWSNTTQLLQNIQSSPTCYSLHQLEEATNYYPT